MLFFIVLEGRQCSRRSLGVWTLVALGLQLSGRVTVSVPAALLATKLFLPPGRPTLVPRSRLIACVNEGLTRPLTLISAPAGFGKTTLISEWRASEAGREFPFACLSLDNDDNDPTRFLTYLVAALGTLKPGLGETALAMLHSPQPPPQVILTDLINDLREFETPFALVLDDYHVIAAQPIQETITFLLDHRPPQMRLVLLTRADPPLPLARLRARDQLTEIRAADLRFTTEEAAAFLNRIMGLNLSPEDVAALEARTEGWVAGLQLAALSMKGRDDTAAFVKAFTGSHIYVAEYLVEEVLKRQPEGVQAFLMQTSILERMNPMLCEAVTGRQDAQAIMTALHRASIFVIPLDDEGQWFRYHHLFADLLQARLTQAFPTEAIAALHSRAAAWHEHNGFAVEAVNHALAARDFERAASLVDQAARTIMSIGQFNLLKNWLEALPKNCFHAHPRLGIYQVLIDLSQGTLDMSEQTLQEKENIIRALPPSPENDRLQVEAMVYLCLFLAHQNTSRTIQIAQETLAEFPEGDPKLRISLFSALYRAYGMDGNIEKSEPAYLECLRLAHAAGQYGVASNTTMVRAFDLCQYGRLHEAARYCQSILESGDRSKQKVFYPAGPAYIGLAGIYLEWNDLETAEHYLKQGIELCRQGGMDGLYTGYAQWARLRQAKGDLEGAWEELRLLEQTFQRRDFTLTARQVSIQLAMGDIACASRLITPVLEILGDSPYAHQLPLIAAEAFKLSLARIHIAQGEIGRANQVLDEIQATVEPGKRFGRLMEVHLLRALALQKREGGNIPSEAIASLERALDLAEPAGFVLLFLEEGPALIPLLHVVEYHQAAPDRIKKYARKLLDAFGGPGKPAAPRPPGEAAGLVEPLTPREMEVLELIAAGDSNQAIADKLVITVRTVKKHTSNIYEKLNASSRIQAVARAREIGLLPAG